MLGKPNKESKNLSLKNTGRGNSQVKSKVGENIGQMSAMDEINKEFKRQQLYEETRKSIRSETFFQAQENQNKYKLSFLPKKNKLNSMNEKGETDSIESDIFYKRNSHPRTIIYDDEEENNSQNPERKGIEEEGED